MMATRAALLLGTLACAALRVQAQTTSSAGIVLDEIDTVFAFGDSYSSTGYSPLLGVTSRATATSSGGYNWLQFLSTLGSTPINLYDLATPGATTKNNITAAPAVDVVGQVGLWNDWFAPGTGMGASQVPWKANSTLFSVWIGINDIGASYAAGSNSTANLPAILASHSAAIASLHAGGARNFLILGVPPTWRTPQIQWLGAAGVQIFQTRVTAYNAALARLVNSYRTTFPDTRFATLDTIPLFTEILAAPRKYGIVEATQPCAAYSVLLNQPNITLPVCKWPLREYMWWNTYHPTWTVHKLLASVVAELLSPPRPTPSATTTAAGAPALTPTGTPTSLTIPATAPPPTTPASSTSGAVGTIGSPPATTTTGSAGAGAAVATHGAGSGFAGLVLGALVLLA